MEWRFLRGRLGNRVTVQISLPAELEADRKIHEPGHQATGMLGVQVANCEPWSLWSPRVQRLPTPEAQSRNILLSDHERHRLLRSSGSCAAELDHQCFCRTINFPYCGNDSEYWDHLPYFVVCEF